MSSVSTFLSFTIASNFCLFSVWMTTNSSELFERPAFLAGFSAAQRRAAVGSCRRTASSRSLQPLPLASTSTISDLFLWMYFWEEGIHFFILVGSCLKTGQHSIFVIIYLLLPIKCTSFYSVSKILLKFFIANN